MKTNEIITFIITDIEDSQFVKSIYRVNTIMDYGNGFILHEPKSLFKFLSNVKDDFPFRLLVHAGLKNEDGVIGMTFLQELKNNFKVSEFTLISRKFDLFPNQESVVDYQGEKLYHTIKIDNNFIDNLFVFKKSDLNENNSINDLADSNSVSKIENQNATAINSADLTSKNEIAILAALNEELKPFRETMEIVKRNGYEESSFKSKTVDVGIRLYSQNLMGMVDASIFTSKVLTEANPDVIIMPGVCGGRKSEKVKLYDIIIPEKALDIITGQYKNGEFIPYGYDSKPDGEFIKHIKGIVEDEDFILKDMYNLIPNKKHERELEILKDLSIHFDVMGCGPFVLKTDKFLDEKAKQMNHKIKGFEMESYGVLRTSELLNKNGLSLIIKSVMDYTDSKKSDTSEFSDAISENVISQEAINEVPPNENIKKMATYFSSICVRALLPYVFEYINLKNSQ